MDPTDEKPGAPGLIPEQVAEPSHEEIIAAGEVPEAPLASPQLPADLAPISGPYGFDSQAAAVPTTDERAMPPSDLPQDAPISAPPDTFAGIPDSARPSYRFFGIVAALSLAADILTKVWAEVVITERGWEPIKIVGDSVAITLAYNKGGAWGMGSGLGDALRKPFFFLVSAFAIFFIISLYGRLHPTQKALKWGLPMVLGGALGNLNDRITRGQVIDFIDYSSDWVMSTNAFVHKYVSSWAVTDHWPTFNVADVAICIGVGLMAVDMFTHRPRQLAKEAPPPLPPQGPGSNPPLSAADQPGGGPVAP